MKLSDKRRSVFKVILLGDSGVGKTSLMNQFVNNLFLGNYAATVGTDFLIKNINIEEENVVLRIWDTAGQERFQSLGQSFYRGTDCCILVYDVTRPRTLSSLNQWKYDFLASADPKDPIGFPFIVIGNKLDLLEEGYQGVQYKKSRDDGERDIPSFIASAKDARNVELAFRTASKRILQREVEKDYEIIRQSEIKLLHKLGPLRKQTCC